MKWWRNPRNWKPDPRPWGFTIIMGKEARIRAEASAEATEYRDTYIFHPVTWGKIAEEHPDFAAQCDLYDRHWRRLPAGT